MRDREKREGLLPRPLFSSQQLINWERCLREEKGLLEERKREEEIHSDRNRRNFVNGR